MNRLIKEMLPYQPGEQATLPPMAAAAIFDERGAMSLAFPQLKPTEEVSMGMMCVMLVAFLFSDNHERCGEIRAELMELANEAKRQMQERKRMAS